MAQTYHTYSKDHLPPKNQPAPKDQLTGQYGAIGPAALVAALMAMRKRSACQNRHTSYMPQQALRPQQTAKQAQGDHPHDNADQAIKHTPGKRFGKKRLQ